MYVYAVLFPCHLEPSIQYSLNWLRALYRNQNVAKSGAILAHGQRISHSSRQTEKVRNKHSELALSPLISAAVWGAGTLLLSTASANLICAPTSTGRDLGTYR